MKSRLSGALDVVLLGENRGSYRAGGTTFGWQNSARMASFRC